MTTKSYVVVTPLRNGGDKPIPPGEPVTLDAAEGDALVALGALTPSESTDEQQAVVSAIRSALTDGVVGGSAARPPLMSPRPKPLGQQNKAELRATAASEGVEVRADAQNAQIVAAIEAKRAEQAA